MKSCVKLQIMALGLSAIVAGCGDGVLPADGGVQTFSPLQTAPVTARTLTPPPSDLPPAMLANYEPIIDGFQKNSATLLRRADIEPRLEQIESVYVATGRYLEMVAIYQADVAQHGLSSAATSSLVWAWMQIGQRKQARDLLDRLLKERPQAPIPSFLEGAYWLPDAQTSSEAAQKTIAAWQKTLELDPAFANFKGFNATILRQQITNLQQRVASAPVTVADIQQRAAQPPPTENQPTEEQPEPEIIEEPKAPEPETPEPKAPEPEIIEEPKAPEPEAPESPEPPKQPESAGILVAQGQISLSRGGTNQLSQARQFFNRALALEPENIGAAVGLFNVRRIEGAPNEALQTELRTLAAHPNLTAQHAYELGMFAIRGVKSNELAVQFLERCQQLDAGYAERAGVPALLQRLKSTQ